MINGSRLQRKALLGFEAKCITGWYEEKERESTSASGAISIMIKRITWAGDLIAASLRNRCCRIEGHTMIVLLL